MLEQKWARFWTNGDDDDDDGSGTLLRMDDNKQ
jgi:hypothetical protein